MHWLFKEEPTHYSYDDLVKEGKTIWSGVKNNLALQNLRKVRKGDLIFYYHSGNEKQIVGIIKAISDAYSTAEEPLAKSKSIAIDVAPEKKLQSPVTLSQIKSDESFRDFELVRISRLSIMPVSSQHWELILKMSREKTG
jgi:predicted RNA-binding protein with PUA-like domain